MRAEEQATALAGPASQWGIGAVLESRPWRCKCRRAGRLTSSAIPRHRSKALLVHLNIYPIDELLEHMK